MFLFRSCLYKLGLDLELTRTAREQSRLTSLHIRISPLIDSYQIMLQVQAQKLEKIKNLKMVQVLVEIWEVALLDRVKTGVWPTTIFMDVRIFFLTPFIRL